MPPTIVIDLAELRPLGDLIQRRLWFFQGTMAALVAGFLTFEAVSMVLNNYWRWNEYPVDFATSVFMGIMAGIFLLVVSIQVKISSARRQNLDYRVEVGKSALATLVWILIVLQLLWSDRNMYNGGQARLSRGFFGGIIVLLVVFYPTLLYAWVVRKYLPNESEEEQRQSNDEQDEPNERQPLLGGEEN